MWCSSDVKQHVLSFLARLRTPSSPNDTLARLCIRLVASSPAFLLASVPPSISSAGTGVPLFGDFFGTTTLSDSRFASASILRVLSFIDASFPFFAVDAGAYRVSRFPCSELPHMLPFFDSAAVFHPSPFRYGRFCFPLRCTGSACKCVCFRSSLGRLCFPLSTLPHHIADDRGMTRGHDGWLSLSCKKLAFSTLYRLSSALSQRYIIVAVRGERCLK